MLWAQFTTKDHIRAETNFNLFPSHSAHVIRPQNSLLIFKFFLCTTLPKKHNPIFKLQLNTTHNFNPPTETGVLNKPQIYLWLLQCTIKQVLKPTYIPWALNRGTWINCLWQRARWPILVYGPTHESALAIANTAKTRERFWKKWRWTDREGRNY